VVAEVVEAAASEAAQRRAAGHLRALGLGRGDRVAFALPSSAALLAAVLGALRTGVVPVLLNATLLPAERHRIVADAGAGLVVEGASGLAAFDGGLPVELAPFPLARPMHYTSGTTGRAKDVYSGLLDDGEAEALFRDEADQWDFGPDDTHLVCSPMSHSVSIRFAAGTLLRGGRLVVLSHFDAPTAAVLLGRLRPSTTFVAPTALRRLLAEPGLPPTLDMLRLLVHAGSPCPPALKRAALARTRPGTVWEFYGSTEGQFTVCSPDEWCERPGTVGRTRPGRRLTVGDDRVIWCRPPPYARFTYWNDPVATGRAWRGDAFTVGDLGRLDGDGFLFLDGRRDDLVITGGVNVYPAEVEAAFGHLVGVEEMAVFGVDDPDWGQRVCAAVMGRVDVAALQAHAAAHLAGYQRPKAYYVVRDLPRTATGKLRRSALPAWLGLESPAPAGVESPAPPAPPPPTA
jgi:long-chain acyl-CoA synthetase